ncbi:MAG TPA: ABC transporter permease [Patescibacteria group bacterium]|nr:ABC transporter permease [Patescibacteria group bacterium]
MIHYLVKRVMRVVPLVILISIVTFVLLQRAPGGPVGLLSGNPKVTGADLERIRENFGLDRPLAVQYFYWFGRVFLHFDFGKSYVTGQPVSRMILERVPATLELMGSAFLLALAAALVMGVGAALRRDRFLDHCFSLVTTAGMSVPVFWLGLMAIVVFSLKLRLLPAGGQGTIGDAGSIADHLKHLILPATVLAFAYLASWSRYLRAGLVETIACDFVRTARAKGLSERIIVFKHVLRNAILPFITVVVMQIPSLFTGAVITETVFSWPGMGRLFYDGLQRQDYTRVLGIVVVSSFLIILFNLAGDLLCMTVDPRIVPVRAGGAEAHGPAPEGAAE